MTTNLSAPRLQRAVVEAADRIGEAVFTRRACQPVRDLLGETDVDAAYAVQRRLNEQRVAAGARVVGRKVALASPVAQHRFGVDHPEFGVLFDDMDVSDMAEVPIDRLLHPTVEAEIAFVLGADLDGDGIDAETVRAAVDHAVAAVEIADSRVADWDVAITDLVADNASAGLFVLGRRRLPLTAFVPRNVTMRMSVDGEPVAQGEGTACFGDPLHALLWLARATRDRGEPLRAGDVVLSGALAPMVPATPGATIRVELSALGSLTATFSRKARM